MRIVELLTEAPIDDLLTKIRSALAQSVNNQPTAQSTAPERPNAPGADAGSPRPGSGTDAAPNTTTPSTLRTPDRENDPVVAQASAQQTFQQRYPANTFTARGIPLTFDNALQALGGDLNSNNVQALERAVPDDTPKEIITTLIREIERLYSREDLESARAEGAQGGFSAAEQAGATALLQYLERLDQASR